MELVVGQNSYITVAEADEIVASRFMSTSKERKLWNSLLEEDKSIVIVTTTEKYDNDNMMYKGTKVDIEQALQFPRIINSKLVDCPETIKAGLIIQCIKDLVADSSEEESLKNMGVKSFADGSGARIEFSDKATSNSLNIDNKIWKQYFSAWSEYGKFIAL
jgi:hypothetical protein